MTGVDESLIYDLTHRVRLVTMSQAARLRSETLGRTKRAIKSLQKAGWLGTRRALIARPLPLHAPLQAWNPGETRPDFAAISHRLMKRGDRQLTATEVVFATRKAAHAFGVAGSGRRRPLQASHDVGLVEALIALRTQDTTRAATWYGEDVLRRVGDMKDFVSDALTVNEAWIAVEYGGASYSAERLRRIHRSCERLGFGYEIW